MNLLQLHAATKQFGAKILFDQAQFSINENEHVGVIGPNGAGKTTLFKIIVGRETLDSGQVIKANGLRIGYLEQESDWETDKSSEQYLTENCLKPIWELKQLGLDLGLTENHFQAPLATLSGGYRMRMKLLEIIGQEPDLMLLDEPTNFLDLESILVLERFLQDYKGAFLLISHDREFLRRVTEYTLEVEGGEIIKFPGHIDDYFEQKIQLRQILAQQAANQEAKRKHLQDFVDRFRAKATKARQAQSRLKQLNKMESIEIKPLPVRSRIHLPVPRPTGKEVVHLEKADLGYSGSADKSASTTTKKILSNANLIIEKNHRVGIVGFNGAGKSTLLKTLAGRLPLLSGQMKLGYQVEISYFAQHLTDELHSEDTVLDALQRKAYHDTLKQEILNIAGSLLFSGDDLEKKIKVLSGGEKTRVALGQILLQKKPLLLMDEPTNHLDFDTVNALAEALATFEGTVVVVSHDRSFIKRVSNRIVEIRDGRVELYPGSYDDYLWSLEKGSMAERYKHVDEIAESKNKMGSAFSTSSDVAGSAGRESGKFNYKEATKKISSEIKELQRKILKTEEIIFTQSKKRDDINATLLSASGLEAARLAKELSEVSKNIEDSEEILMTHMENLDLKEKELAQLKG